ncbi:PH domain-containing protein [Tessaracoccus caeni]|uniref:PH domain-containing protein n=1 Tax=Tessaracoccus caeni TaxID=3031239 RepID=UPI0023DB9579|nr:PH domain-containing protein [Tessaracoccus caeni]MDF1490356.1 PH domain-containing protein [Tessaracoccus caeni]
MSLLGRLLEPQVRGRLLWDEVVIDEVQKHWVASFPYFCLMGLSIPLFLLMIFVPQVFWLPLLAGLVSLTWGLAGFHRNYMDRFVVTNMRVFRVHGIFDQHMATMPMSRILDISMQRTLLGMILGYGHFIFETAAQDQGLREIRFVGRPDARDKVIQRIIQRAGLRQRVEVSPSEDEDDGA